MTGVQTCALPISVGLASHDPSWTDRFEAEAAEIRHALPQELVVRVDHVGSTAVPGIAAKPVVDIQLSLTSMTPRSAYRDPLVRLGFRWVPDPWDDDHDFFSRDDAGGERAVHVHACRAGGPWERRHLAFRDALRADPVTAAAYERLKVELAAAHPNDVYGYTDAKSTFIRDVEERAGRASHA